jgi:squalene-associated FAD-dependent desaturase
MATIAFMRRVRRGHYRCASNLSVASILVDQPPPAVARLWAPLCIAALNTPIDYASGQVFLNVLRTAFAAHARHSDLLFPRVDLSALFPDAAAAYIASRGGEIRVDRNVDRIAASDQGIAVNTAGGEEAYAAAVIAVAPHQLYRLFDRVPPPAPLRQALAQVAAFAYEPITTAYLRYPQPLALAQPMLRLDDSPGQWVFDRGQLGGPAGLAAVVISTDLPAASIDHTTLALQMDAQLRRLLPKLPAPAWSRVIAERRATYACIAGLARPAPGAHGTSVYLAGDYTDAEFPATLEAATRSGVSAAKSLLANLARRIR